MTRSELGRWGFRLLLVTAMMLVVTPVSVAQDAAPETAEEAEQDTGEETGETEATGAREIEEITVTARRRAENLQEVPVAVSAITADAIIDMFAQRSTDLAKVSPNLVFDHIGGGSPRAGGISIRGVSFQDVEPSFDPAVGVVMDGVYLATNVGAVFQLMDLERVEVLRGPQGTLFGKNTIGGIINVTRKRPTGELGGLVRLLGGDYSRGELDAIVDFPLGDKVAGKVSFTTRTQGEGYTFNQFTGTDAGEVDYMSFGADLLWTPTDDVEVYYSYQRVDDDSDQTPTLNVSQPGDMLCFLFQQCATSETGPSTGDRHVADQDGTDVASFDLDFHNFQAKWDINDRYSLKYILGYRDSVEHVNIDFDGAPVEFFSADNRNTDLTQTSHELQLAYASDRFNYVAGLYLWDAEYTLTQDTRHFFNVLWSLGVFGPLPVEPGVGVEWVGHSTESQAAFFQADYDFTDQWTLTFGGRYTTEKKQMERAVGWSNYGGLDPAITFDTRGLGANDEWSEFTPKLGVRYQIDNEAMTYLTYSSGFRSGGYNGRAGSLASALEPYDPETVDSLELGYKAEFLNRSLRLNTAAFFSQYNDKQEEIIAVLPGGQETVVKNAADVEISGLEVELLALPTEGLTLNFNLGLLDAKYVEFDADLNGDGTITDNTFLQLRRAPDYNFTLGAQYDWQVGAGQISANASYHYTDDYYITILNDAIGLVDAYGILDAAINYQFKSWRVSLFGNNLTNEDYYEHSFSLPGLWAFAYARPPRTVGLQLLKTF